MRGIKYYLSELFLRPVRITLVSFMGLSKWHIATTSNKQYSDDVLLYLNSLKLERVAEIGCGACDILRNINCDHRFGFDIDPGVLKFANILNHLAFKKVSLSVYDFLNDDILWDFNAVLLLNWPHEIEAKKLKIKLDIMIEEMSIGSQIIIDTVSDNNYQFNHNIADLFSGRNVKIKIISSYERRVVYAIILL